MYDISFSFLQLYMWKPAKEYATSSHYKTKTHTHHMTDTLNQQVSYSAKKNRSSYRLFESIVHLLFQGRDIFITNQIL